MARRNGLHDGSHRELVDERNHEYGDNNTRKHCGPDGEGDAIRHSVRNLKDVWVAVEECEENKVQQDEVESKDEDDGLGEGQGEGAVQVSHQARAQGAGGGVLGVVAVVARQVAQMFGAPLEQQRGECLGLCEQDEHEPRADEDHGDPVGPGKADGGRVGSDDGPEDGPGVGAKGAEGQAERDLHGRPDVAHGAARDGHGRGGKEGREEAKGQGGAVAGGQGLVHDEQHDEDHVADVNDVAAEGL